MSTIRCFLAVEIDDAARESITGLIRKMSVNAPDVRWAVPENLHLTLKFFGDVEETDTWEIFKAIQAALGDMPSFRMRFATVGAFPADDRPRAVWIGIEEGRQMLCNLQACIDQRMLDLGYPSESRRYQPHLTIGRARDKISQLGLVTAIKQQKHFQGGWIEVDRLTLFRSELGRGKNAAPVYTKLGSNDFLG